jgi:hypothetical protein
MDNSRILNKLLAGKFHGRRPVGRHDRWEDKNRTDSSLLLNVKGWRKLTGRGQGYLEGNY